MTRVVITGYGIVSPIGNDADSFLDSLKTGKNGIGPITKFDASQTGIHVAGEVKDFPLEKYFVKTILNRKSQFKESYPKLLIVTPPVINEYTEYCKKDNKYLGATEKSKQLNTIYEDLAKKYNCYFLSNAGLDVGMDGVHLTEESHKKLAELLYQISDEKSLVLSKNILQNKKCWFIINSAQRV